jgi:hypothetical protein
MLWHNKIFHRKGSVQNLYPSNPSVAR